MQAVDHMFNSSGHSNTSGVSVLIAAFWLSLLTVLASSTANGQPDISPGRIQAQQCGPKHFRLEHANCSDAASCSSTCILADEVTTGWRDLATREARRAFKGKNACLNCTITLYFPRYAIFKLCNGSLFLGKLNTGNFSNVDWTRQMLFKYTLQAIVEFAHLLRFKQPCVDVLAMYDDSCRQLTSDTKVLSLLQSVTKFFPPLMQSGSHWVGSTQQCHSIAFPLYYWNWPGSADPYPGAKEARFTPIEWEHRISKMVYRGSSKNILREKVVEATRNRTDLFNVQVWGRCLGCFENNFERMTLQQMALYKYVLVVDGWGPTNRVKHMLFLGSVLLMVESMEYNFYFIGLMPWVHYIPVSHNDVKGDLITKVEWVKNHDDEARKIAANGRAYALKYINYNHLAFYQHQALLAYKNESAPYAEQFNITSYAEFCCSDYMDARVVGLKWLESQDDFSVNYRRCMDAVAQGSSICGNRTESGKAEQNSILFYVDVL